MLLTVLLAVMGVAASHAQTVLIDESYLAPSAGGQPVVDFFTTNYPDVTVTVGNYDNTTDAGVRAAIEAADVLVINRRTYSGAYDAADAAYYAGLSDTVVVYLTSYVTRSSRMAIEGGLNAGAGVDGAETTVTAAGSEVFGVGAGTYDWFTLGFDTLGTGSVGTGTVLATIGGNNLAVGWQAGDTDSAGRIQAGRRLLFNLDAEGGTNLVRLPQTEAGLQAFKDAIDAYTLLGVSPYAATAPNPAKGAVVDLTSLTEMSWQDCSDPNVAAVQHDLVFGTEPNMLLNAVYPAVSNPLNLASENIYLDYDTTYYWRIDTIITWDSNDITGNWQDVAVGTPWFFTVLPEDKIPGVTADAGDMDILTSLEFLPADLTGMVNDSGEGDIQSVTWEVIGNNAPATAMQMMTRGSAAALGNLAQIGITDPNLLMDWIGTDTRDDQPNKPLGDPMVLTLKGLPSDTYTWKSYHHDPDATFTGIFDAVVMDASGKTATADIQISDSNELPIAAFETTITANGTDDIVLFFDLHPYAGLGYNDAWFVMNGFELTSSNGSLNIDFGNTSVAMPGYQAYVAQHEVLNTFTEQSYNAFGTTVSVLPAWGGIATVTDTTVDLLSPTAILETDWPGAYLVRLSASDLSWTGSDTMTVRVAADACAAALLDPAWGGFNSYDADEDCDVDLSDFAALAQQWLDDRNAAGQIQF